MSSAVTEFPLLSDPYELAPETGAHYLEHGWTVVRGLCSGETMDAYSEIIREATIQHNRETRPLEERETYGKAFLQTMNLWQLDPRVAAFTLAPRFAQVAASLLGVDRVRLYHDQSLFKEPNGGPTPWHQDGFFWPVDPMKAITMWMPLVDVPAEMGSMSFADGSHLHGIIETRFGISDQSEAYYQGFVDGRGFSVRTSGPMAAGDATFHNGVTLHRAPGNPTDRVRAIMTIIYVADGERVQEPSRPAQQGDLEQWVPGRKPGDLIDSALNPLLG